MAVRNRGRVFGLYRDFPSLRLGVDSLKALSFTNGDISVLLPESAISKALPDEDDLAAPPQTEAAFIGGALEGMTYVRPERAGIIADALTTLGMRPRQADMYEHQLRSGSLLVSIQSRSTAQIDDATAALIATGAESVIASRSSMNSEPGRTAHAAHSAALVETLLAC